MAEQQYAQGGYITGPGPALIHDCGIYLQPGERFITAAEAKAEGKRQLDRLRTLLDRLAE